MTEQFHQVLSQHWVTIKDEQSGLRADFPHIPLEMTFDIPFQNTPPKGQIYLYSVPTAKGLMAVSIFHSPSINTDMLHKKQLHQFFETILVPHFFFNPLLFQNHQTFHLEPIQLDEREGVFFRFSFQDGETVKKLEGIALIKDQILYTPFYLASEKDFDQEVLNRFLSSIRLPTNH